jgi:oligosaccharide translocation protein RFT1
MSSNENLIINNESLLNLNCKIIFHLINLIFNSLIIRNIDLNLIGIVNIHLELFYSTILFLSRESLRHNIPKLNDIHSIYHYINLIWLIIPFGFYFILFSLFLTLFIQINPNEKFLPDYNQACFMYGLSAFIQLLSEPFYLLSTLTQNYRVNIYIQFIASIIGFGFQTILIIKNPDSALFYYGFGHIIYSILITLFYYFYFLIQKSEDRSRLFLIKSLNDLLIKPTSPFIDDKLLNETFKSLKKQISMRILTEGEKYLITMFSLISYEEQGIYHLIYLLGSFFPRFIFPTIEQISFDYFQQIFSQTKINSDNDDHQPLTLNGIQFS